MEIEFRSSSNKCRVDVMGKSGIIRQGCTTKIHFVCVVLVAGCLRWDDILIKNAYESSLLLYLQIFIKYLLQLSLQLDATSFVEQQY